MPRKSDSLEVLFPPPARSRFLDLLRTGYGRASAARSCGVSWATVSRFAEANPDFLIELSEAEQQANQPVIDKLYDSAREGEPWAVKLWLEARAEEFKRTTTLDVKVSGKIEVTAQTADEVLLELQRRAQLRAQEAEAPALYPGTDDADIIDAEIIERPAVPAPPPSRRVS